jgi:hypothetical protein
MTVSAGKRQVECLDEVLGYPLNVPLKYLFQVYSRPTHVRKSIRVQPRRLLRRGA